MFNFHLSYKWIYFRAPQDDLRVPDGLQRDWVQTPGGRIEILSARPQGATSQSPIYFVHGGMGCAWMWSEYMRHLAKQGIPCYAVSLRGHGASWKPSFLRMVYGTTKRMLADDAIAGLEWVQQREGREVVLVGHSSGGGLSQLILSEKNVRVKGLALLGAVPGFGS